SAEHSSDARADARCYGVDDHAARVPAVVVVAVTPVVTGVIVPAVVVATVVVGTRVIVPTAVVAGIIVPITVVAGGMLPAAIVARVVIPAAVVRHDGADAGTHPLGRRLFSDDQAHAQRGDSDQDGLSHGVASTLKCEPASRRTPAGSPRTGEIVQLAHQR